MKSVLRPFGDRHMGQVRLDKARILSPVRTLPSERIAVVTDGSRSGLQREHPAT